MEKETVVRRKQKGRGTAVGFEGDPGTDGHRMKVEGR